MHEAAYAKIIAVDKKPAKRLKFLRIAAAKTRFKLAVTRNRIKRIIRHSFFEYLRQQEINTENWKVVLLVVVKKNMSCMSSAQRADILLKIWTKAINLIVKQHTANNI